VAEELYDHGLVSFNDGMHATSGLQAIEDGLCFSDDINLFP